MIFVVIGVCYRASILDRGGDAGGGIRSRHGCFVGYGKGTEGGRVKRHSEPVVQDVDSRMQGRSETIEFDCCQGESLCCRDLGRFGKVRHWLNGSRWRRNVRKWAETKGLRTQRREFVKCGRLRGGPVRTCVDGSAGVSGPAVRRKRQRQ